MDPTLTTADLDTSVDQLLREVDAKNPGGPSSVAPAVGEDPNAAVDDLLADALVETGGAAPPPGESGGAPAARTEPVSAGAFADVESILGEVQSDLRSAPADSLAPAAAGASTAVVGPPAGARTIEDLDAALASRASTAIAIDTPQASTLASPLALAVAANPHAAPMPDGAVAVPIEIPAAAPASPGKSPPPASKPDKAPAGREPRRARRGVLGALLGPPAARAQRLTESTQQTLRWAAYVTFVAAAALWAVVLLRSSDTPSPGKDEPGAMTEDADKAPSKADHAEKPPASKPGPAKPAAKPAASPAKRTAAKSASAAGHH